MQTRIEMHVWQVAEGPGRFEPQTPGLQARHDQWSVAVTWSVAATHAKKSMLCFVF